MAYLLSGNEEIQAHVAEQGAVDVDTRLAIYRNAYVMRFKETIETDHEMLGIYLGDEMFDQMVADYVAAQPSDKRSLRQYADALPVFLTTHTSFAQYPQIAELAAFERLLLSAFDARDALRIGLAELQELPAADWPRMQVRFHPSVQLFQSRWHAVPIWQALKAGEAPPAALEQDAYWALWRNNELLTEFRSVTTREWALMQAALRGDTFAQLCELLLEYCAQEEVAAVAVTQLQQWLSQGFLIQLH